jgi:putative glutamine amidotransferase
MTRPRIALTTPVPTSENDTYARYARALERAGAAIVEVRPGDELPPDVDGVCLSGGPDVDPTRYGEADAGVERAMVDAARDGLEFAIAQWALEQDIPVLAVCRGFQVLNVVMKGKLLQDVSGHRASDHVTHRITATPGSRLAAACGSDPMTVNSRHHQAVTPDRLAPALVATVQHDGLVEAFESVDHRWVVGVQWHPERVLADEEPVDSSAARIFDAFVAEARRAPSVTIAP